jgi:hypothetical protein
MGLLTVAVLVFASLFLPPRVEEMRSGYWGIEHFLAYFLATFVVFMGDRLSIRLQPRRDEPTGHGAWTWRTPPKVPLPD